MHQAINLKPSPSIPVASSTNKPGVSNAVWRAKLEELPAAQAPEARIAKLLQKAGIIAAAQYCDAVEIAESLQQPVDQVLLTSFLSEGQTHLCNMAISYLDKGLISESLAVQALSFANVRQMDFATGLRYNGYGW